MSKANDLVSADHGFKIRMRTLRGYLREAQGYTAWDEYQVVAGRRIVGRYEMLAQAQRAFPNAELDVSVVHEAEIRKKQTAR